MPRSLPSHPSVRFLQKEAKDLLKAHKSGAPSCCPTLRYHFRFSRATDAEILKAEVSLQEVQHALALDYGLKDWKELKACVETQSTSSTSGGQVHDIIGELIKIAVRDRASDLHIEPMNADVKVRYRIDGVLHEMPPLSRDVGLAVVDAISRMCKLDMARTHLPRDGRMMLEVQGRKIDIRVNVSPVIHGNVVAMRLLDRGMVSLSLEALGMEPDQLALYEKQINAPDGVVLVVGPTGCGKTTTLYATLTALNDQSRKIMTVEDPVEFALEGIDQMPIRPQDGLGFEQALRSVLRQAVNVIMAGEIRNVGTAQLLVQRAFTGHLAFSTLHTNDCPGTLMRLINMGVEPWLVTDAIRCVVAQRLVREICEHCKTEYRPESGAFASLQLSADDRDRPMFRGGGCERCHQTGYSGRGAIYSIMPMTSSVARQVMNKDAEAIEAAATADGWTTLREAAIRKLLRGETTVEEVIKFT